MANDDLDHIPSIIPTRDSETHYATAKGRGASTSSSRGSSRGGNREGSGGTGVFVRLVITVSLVVAAVACAWAWQLQEQLEQAGFDMVRYGDRIADLEARLSDTDEGMSQSATAHAVKIKELYSEVDKLWASAWRTNKAKIADLEGASASQAKQVATLTGSLSTAQAQVKAATGEIGKLKSLAGDLERLMSSASVNQAEVERVADTLNRINLDIAKLSKRVEANEEWLASINAFRRQINSSLTEIQANIRTLQQTP